MADKLNQEETEQLKKEFIRCISLDVSRLETRDIPAINVILDSPNFPKVSGRIKCTYGEYLQTQDIPNIVLTFTPETTKYEQSFIYDRRTIDAILDRINYLSENATIKSAKNSEK